MVDFDHKYDKCATCVHEHENWGDNEHCRRCKKNPAGLETYHPPLNHTDMENAVKTMKKLQDSMQ